jgi:thiol-disulfide isomerase/thioredoxin
MQNGEPVVVPAVLHCAFSSHFSHLLVSKGQSSMKRFFSIVRNTAAVGFLGTVSAMSSLAFADDTLTIGSKAPALDVEHWVQNGEGKFSKVTDFQKDKVYVVEFWATWCGPCVASMPHIVEMQKEYSEKGVQIISISDEPLDTVKEFLDRSVPRSEKEMTFADLTKSYCLTTDPDGSSNKDYMEAASQNGIPCAFLVGKDGKIEWIGHPMELDAPLKAVVENKWDREKFAEQFVESQQIAALQMKVQKEVGGLLRAKKFDEALAKFDELTESVKNPMNKLQFTMMKVNLHQIAGSKQEELAKTLKQAMDLGSAEPMMGNQIAWMVWEMIEQGKLEKNEALLNDALKLATTSAGKLEGPSKGATLDTAAHLYYALGDLAKAVATQEEAIKAAGDQASPDMNDFLEELKEEAAKKK